MSISIRADFSQVMNVANAMRVLEQLDTHELLDDLGAETESQIRRRIQDEKRSPDGLPWPAWSPAYAKTRHGGHSLLQGEGNYLDSIQYIVEGDHVEIGSNLPYAARQNLGDQKNDGGIPAREHLGFSDENAADLAHVVDDFLRRQLEAL